MANRWRQALRAAGRSGLLLIAAFLIAGALIAMLGRPSAARLHRADEIARFRPTLGHGLVQLIGEGLLLVVIVYIGRRWLRMRL